MRRARGAAFVALALIALPAPAASSPSPPCGGEAVPDYPAVGEPPAVEAWFGDGESADWTPPSCTEWQARGFATIIGMAARFRHDGGLDTLLARIGGISDSTRIRYWSVTRKRWRDLVDDAYALSSDDPDSRRRDFSADELVPGSALYFLREPNSPIGATVFRMTVLERDAERVVLKVENSSPIRLFRVPVLAAGEQELLVFLERESEYVWRFYSLTRTGEGVAWRARQRMPSYVNRAVAEYRHLAGIPTDHEPPAIP